MNEIDDLREYRKKGKKDALCVTVVKMILLVAKEMGRYLVI